MSFANVPSSAGNISNPLGTMLPVKEESPADAGISDMPIFSVPRESTQSTPASTFTNSSQHLKQEGYDMREPPSVAAATVASLPAVSDSGPPQHSWSSTDPSHPFANAVARGYRTYVIVTDEPNERPDPEAIDERARRHTHESRSARSHGAYEEPFQEPYHGPYQEGDELRYAQRHQEPYHEQYQERCQEPYGQYEGWVYEQTYDHGHERSLEYSHQDVVGTRMRPYERSFQQDTAHAPGQAYDAVHEAAYDVAHANEHSHEPRQEDNREHARRHSSHHETRHPRRIPPLVAFERLATTMGEPPRALSDQTPKTPHAEVPDRRTGMAPYDAMDVDTPEPSHAEAVHDSSAVLSSSPSTRNSIAGDSSEPSAASSAPSSTSPPAQNTLLEDESAHDTIATRRPIRMARLPKPTVQPAQPSPTPAARPTTRQATKPPANSPGKPTTKPIAKPVTRPVAKPISPTATKTTVKALSKPPSRRASAPIERRATRLSGIQPDSLLSSTPLGKRRRRVSERDALSSVPRELRRLQDTKEFAHVDDKPVIYTVWSNGRYVPANAAGEPLPDKNATAKAAKAQNGQKGDPAEPAHNDQEGSTPEAPKPAQKRTKKWLSKGLYAGQSMPANHAAGLTATEKKALAKLPELSKPYPPNKTLPMPIYNGLRMLIQGRDFKMPFDVFHPLPPGQPKPVKYGKMSKNRFVGEAHAIWKKSPNYDDFQSKCVCKPETGCDEDCQNRIMLYECNDSICNVGADLCNNREFQRLAERTASKNPYHIGVEVFKTPNRGHGIRASRSFRPGQIIMEYIGEIITEEESDRRMNELYKDNECYYLMSFDQSLIIDGTSGSFARFVNHSCSPNCRMIKWIVSGQPRIALFAGDRPIMSGEELTYDYNFDPYSSKNVQRCLCDSENCRGVLGPRKSEKITKAAAEKAAADKEKAEMASAASKLGKRKRDAQGISDSGNAAKKMRSTAAPLRQRGRPALNSASGKVTTTKAALEALAAEAAKQARAARAAKAKKAKRAAKAAEAAKAAKGTTTKSGTLAKKVKTPAAATRVFKANKKTKIVFTKRAATTVASNSAAKLTKDTKATKQTGGTAAKRTAKGTKPAKGTTIAKASKIVTVKTHGTVAPPAKRTKVTATGVGKPPSAKTKSAPNVTKTSKDTKTAQQRRGPKLKMASNVLRTATPPVLEPIVNEARSPATKATPMAKALAAKAAKRAAEAAEVAGATKAKATKVAKVAKNGVVKPIRATTPALVKTRVPHKALKKVGQPSAKTAVAAAITVSSDPANVPVKRGRGRPRLSPEDLAKRAAKAAAKAAMSKAKTAASKARRANTKTTARKTDMVDTPMADMSGEEQELALQFLNDKAIAQSMAAVTAKAPPAKAVAAGSKVQAAVLPLSSPLPGIDAPRRKRGRPRKVVIEAAPVEVSSATMDTIISNGL